MTQQDLFEVGERDIHGVNARDSLGRRKHPLQTCTPAAIGSGPKGETCRTCKHKFRKEMGKVYLKCNLMRKWWTGGAATDIKARWPACRKWEAKGETCESNQTQTTTNQSTRGPIEVNALTSTLAELQRKTG